MEKIVDVGSWPRASDSPVALVRMGGGGLRGSDRDAFVKRADHAFVAFIDRVKLAADELPIHVLAVHATEAMGPNRNGGGFTEETCRKYHTTFVKYARHYEGHRNKDPRRSYGDVRLSVYNEPMRRIELLVVGNLTKDAARRNGGLVLPEEVVERLERGEDVGWSMACKVAYDVCSICGNRAPSRSHYCTEETCVDPETGMRGHGCRSGLMKLCEDGRLQYVDNPEPTFFDISRVQRPADRQAYGWKADYLLKAASCEEADSAGAVAVDFSLLDPLESQRARNLQLQTKVAEYLAQAEEELDRRPPTGGEAAAWATESVSLEPWPSDRCKRASLLRALADRRVLLRFDDFLRASGVPADGVIKLAEDARRILPSIARTLARRPELPELLAGNPYAVDRWVLPSVEGRRLAEKLAADRSADVAEVRRRAWRDAVPMSRPPQGGTPSPEAAAWALRYGLYKIAALAAMADGEGGQDFYRRLPLIARAALVQNRVNGVFSAVTSL